MKSVKLTKQINALKEMAAFVTAQHAGALIWYIYYI
jgi:hypothetical protein